MSNEPLKESYLPHKVTWNENTKLILSDVDETIADLYVKASQEMIHELTFLLEEGKVFFFVTGQGIKSVQWRIVDQIPKNLRHRIIVGHCSGAEVLGYNKDGSLNDKPYYSIYDKALTDSQKKQWRELVNQLAKEFNLQTHPTMPVKEFKEKFGDEPLAVMIEDRGPQITFEVVNGYDLTAQQASKLEISIPQSHGNIDLRIPILERAEQLFDSAGLPITPRLGGEFAVDFAIKGVSKTTSVKHILEDESILTSLGLTKDELQNSNNIEIWGDKFSTLRGGTDRHMSEAVPQSVRSIDFRLENPE